MTKENEGGFGQRFRRLHPRVLKRLQRLGFTLAAAEDLSQDVFLAAWRNGRWPETDDDFGRWLFGIVRNKVLQLFEREQRRGVQVPVEALDTGSWAASTGGLDAVLTEERRTRLDVAIRALPPQQRRCLLLRTYQGRSVAEVARILRISEGTVKAHSSHARRNLRKALGREFDGLVGEEGA